jgi:hypothetical protein
MVGNPERGLHPYSVSVICIKDGDVAFGEIDPDLDVDE